MTIVCSLVFLGCNWQGTFDTRSEAEEAERQHWQKKHMSDSEPEEEE